MLYIKIIVDIIFSEVKNNEYFLKTISKIKANRVSFVVGIIFLLIIILIPIIYFNPLKSINNKKQIKSTGKIDEKAATTKKENFRKYTIQSGDYLWTIAEKMYGDGYAWTKIAAANNLSENDILVEGNTIIIP